MAAIVLMLMLTAAMTMRVVEADHQDLEEDRTINRRTWSTQSGYVITEMNHEEFYGTWYVIHQFMTNGSYSRLSLEFDKTMVHIHGLDGKKRIHAHGTISPQSPNSTLFDIKVDGKYMVECQVLGTNYKSYCLVEGAHSNHSDMAFGFIMSRDKYLHPQDVNSIINDVSDINWDMLKYGGWTDDYNGAYTSKASLLMLFLASVIVCVMHQ